MAGALINVKIEDRAVLEKLAAIRARTENMRPVWANVGQIILESIMRNFQEHRAPDGTPWKDVSPAYARWKSKKGYSPGNILILSGGRGGLLSTIHADPGSDSVTIGTNVVYAAIHQLGGSIVVGGRSQTLAHDKSGQFMSRKQAGRRKTGSTRVSCATIGPHAADMGARPDDWRRISVALQKYIVTGEA